MYSMKNMQGFGMAGERLTRPSMGGVANPAPDRRGVTQVNLSTYTSINSTIALKIMLLFKYSKQMYKYDNVCLDL